MTNLTYRVVEQAGDRTVLELTEQSAKHVGLSVLETRTFAPTMVDAALKLGRYCRLALGKSVTLRLDRVR